MDDLNVNSCRICFAANACVSLFDDRGEFNVASLLESAINIKVELNEHISSLICSKCFEMINTSVKLKQSVELAEERWNKFFVYVWISNRKEDIDQNMAHIKREEDSSDNNDDKTDREGEYQFEENSKENPDPLELVKHEIGSTDNNDSKSVGDYIQDVEVKPNVYDGISNGSNKISRKHEAKNKGGRCGHQANRRFKCLECGKSFKFKTSLDCHLTMHTGAKNHNCEICNKSFIHKSLLNRHIRQVHYNEKGHPCTKCDKIFASSSRLKNHFRIHTGENPFECKYCDLTYTQSCYLERHTRLVHYKEKGHRCTKCDKIFPTSIRLRNHFRTHTGEKPYECKYCDWKFAQSSNLAAHIRCKHLKNNDQFKPKENGHACTKCDKTFVTPSKLRDHFRIHTGEKPFACKYCDWKFNRPSTLASHTRCKHLKPNEKRHPCTKCDKTFRTLSNLKGHFRIHTGEKPFECKYCDVKYTHSSSLRFHTHRKHPKTNDQFKPTENGHPCTKCDKTFLTPSKLRDHFRIHTGEKPFECKYCDLKFTYSNSLAKHTRHKHLNNDQFNKKK